MCEPAVEPADNGDGDSSTAKKIHKRDPFIEALFGLDHGRRSTKSPGPTLSERFKQFRGNDSPATVTLGCASIFFAVVLASATIWLAFTANKLLQQQNDLILADTLPTVSASMLPTSDGGFTLTVENSGNRATFHSIEPMTLLRFTFKKYNDDLENGYVAIYDVFEYTKPNPAGTGELATITSRPAIISVADKVCPLIMSADDRINECQFEVSMLVRYQTNTDDIHTNAYLFNDEIALQISVSELQRQTQRWDDGPNNRTGFLVVDSPPDDLVGWVDD